MRKIRLFCAALLSAALLSAGLATSARAQLTLSLLNAPVTVTAGGSAFVSGTIANPLGGDPQDLGGLSILIDSPLTTDETPFAVFPTTLNGGDSAFGDIFGVLAPLTTTPGIYNGTLTLLNNAGDAISPTTPFSVNVIAASAAPEPGSIALLGVGLWAMSGIMRRRHRS